MLWYRILPRHRSALLKEVQAVTTFGEFLNLLVGWLGDFVRWLISFVPRYIIIHVNQVGVKYTRGRPASELGSGVHWYWPWQTTIRVLFTARDLLTIPSISIETSDDIAVQVGAVLTYHISNAVKYEVENFEAAQNMAEVAQGALRNIVTTHTWKELSARAEEGSRLEGKLARRMQEDLSKFGVTVESVRPTDQVRLASANRVFGVNLSIQSEGPLTPGGM